MMQEPVEVSLEGSNKVYCIPLEDMLQKLLNDELVLEEVYIMSLHFYLQELSEITTKKIALEVS